MQPQPMITVRSVQQAAAFYCRLLDARPGHGGEEYEQILWNGELVLQLHAYGEDAHHPSLGDAGQLPGNGVVLWFETDDFDALLARVREHGIVLDKEPLENPFAKQMECWLHDPDGYQVVIAGPSGWSRAPV